ncbi:MAG: complex I NDUFA9 subunit family protein, partial [Gemmatimonadetes bacterium]|nr:complex I NDUFA9 subunit family protein [Gemmatimonadota bacterium]
MLVAMTGATGFVGSHVVQKLLRHDHEVRILSRHPETAGWLRDRGIEVVAGDLEDQASLRALVAGAEAVVHLVGIIVELGGQTYQRVHVGGTRNVVGAARETGVRRFVHMSALGARPNPEATPYHRTKAAAEDVMRTSGLSHAILRPSLIAGPGSPPLKMMVDMLRLSPVIPVIGDGKYQLQPVDAEDVAEVFAVAVERHDLQGTFDIAGPEPLTYHQMLDQLEQALGVKRRRVAVPVGMVRFAANAGMALPNLNPITPDQLTMLLEGSTTANNATLSVFGVAPRRFADVAREICEPYAARVGVGDR